jgi:hypothetical protein
MRHGDLWVFLFFLGLILFNWPVISVFAAAQPYAIFALWAAFIAVTALLSYIVGRERNR